MAHLLGHYRVLRVVWLGRRQQGLEGEHGRLEGESGRPLVLEDVQTDGPVLTADVGVPGRRERGRRETDSDS